MSPAIAALRSLHTADHQEQKALPLADLDEQNRLLGILFYTASHFFGDIRKLFSGITDPRNQKKITYSVDELCFAVVLMFMFGLKARRQIGFCLRGGVSADRFRAIFDAPDCPHGDTINNAFAAMDPAEFQSLICQMAHILIRKKVLYHYRVLGQQQRVTPLPVPRALPFVGFF